MADVKISQLTALASANVVTSSDVLPIVDASVPQTKKITVENLLAPVVLNKATNAIGIGTAPNTWNSLHSAVQLGYGALAVRQNNNTTYLTNNLYYESSGSANVTYIHENEASTMMLSDGNMIFFNAPSGTGTATLTERLRVDTEGNVGIGSGSNTNSHIVRGFSANKGLVIETQQPAIQLVDSDNNGRYFTMAYEQSAKTVYMHNQSNGPFRFDTNGVERFSIEGGGKLKSTSGIYFTGNALDGTNTGISSSGDGGDLRIYTNGTNSTTFKSDGKVGIGDSSPDALLSIKGDSDGGTTPSIRLKDGSDTREAWISNYSGDLVIANGGDDNVPHCKIQMYDGNLMTFSTSNTERFRVDDNGTFKIQESTGDPDSAKLYLQSTKTYTDDEYENFDIAGRGAIVTVAVTTSGNQRSGLFFIDTASITVIKVADPSSDFAASDTDDKICVFKSSGNSNTFQVKNRKGGDRAISVGIIATGA